MIADFYDLALSPAVIETFLTIASNSLDTYEQEVRMKLLKSPILHADETGFYVEGERWWLHSLSTAKLTYYGVHQNRGKKAIESIGVIPHYSGVLVHDFWNAYPGYPCTHAYCNTHIIRELQGIFDGFKQEWAKDMRALLERMYEYVFKRESHSECKIQELLREYERILLQGELANPPPPKEEGKKGKPKNTKAGNLVERLKKHKDGILLFLTSRGKIPFTNNQAERDVRMMKVQQKISGTFRTRKGAINFARRRGYISTMRKLEQPVYEAVKALAQAQPILISSLERE
jgi:transposase